MKQIRAHISFKLMNMIGNCRLRDPEEICCLCKALRVGDSDEIPQITKLHNPSSIFMSSIKYIQIPPSIQCRIIIIVPLEITGRPDNGHSPTRKWKQVPKAGIPGQNLIGKGKDHD